MVRYPRTVVFLCLPTCPDTPFCIEDTEPRRSAHRQCAPLRASPDRSRGIGCTLCRSTLRPSPHIPSPGPQAGLVAGLAPAVGCRLFLLAALAASCPCPDHVSSL